MRYKKQVESNLSLPLIWGISNPSFFLEPRVADIFIYGFYSFGRNSACFCDDRLDLIR